MAKFELIFVLTQENVFSWRFHFRANRKGIGSNNGTRDFQTSRQFPYERSACLYVTISGNFECSHCCNFEINFLKNENLFQKTGLTFFS